MQITDSAIELFCKNYRNFLINEGHLTISQFIDLYIKARSFLHKKAGHQEIDFSTLTYTSLRLPDIIYKIKDIVLGKTDVYFFQENYHINTWKEVTTPARRRKTFYDGSHTLGVFITSVSDTDDLICLLTAFQVEWNKIHKLLNQQKMIINEKTVDNLQEFLKIPKDRWIGLHKIWKENFVLFWQKMKLIQLDFNVKLLGGSYLDYKTATQKWFDNIVKTIRYKDIVNKPFYFVSSNTHSLVNNITGWVNKIEKKLIDYIYKNKETELISYWNNIQSPNSPGLKENFLWYLLKKYEIKYPEARLKRKKYEQDLGIDYVEARHFLDINTQVIKVSQLVKSHLMTKLCMKNFKKLEKSDAYITNIDYPLGNGAYIILSTILENTYRIKGIYVLGKASLLNGKLGDISLPNAVFDIHSKNEFIFKNAISKHYFPNFKTGNILTNHRSISVKGTFLQSEKIIKKYFNSGYSSVEMECGPYLNAVYETSYWSRYPENRTLSLVNSPIDIGIIHYASDTFFTKTITLGTKSLGYEGVEATYSSSLAILKRIIELETS